MDDNSEPVQVVVRIRPEIRDGSPSRKSLNSSWNSTGSGGSSSSCVVADLINNSVKVVPPEDSYGARKNVSAVDDKVFYFDKVYSEDASQEDIYQCVAANVFATVNGYNTTIFAYGATGSGKTYTMTGNKSVPGVIPRAIGDIFRHIENTAATEKDVFFYVRLSYVELYNNIFRNLLEHVSRDYTQSRGNNSSQSISMSGFFSDLDDYDNIPTNKASYTFSPHKVGRQDKIEVRESQSAGVFLAGPNLRIPVTSALEAFQMIAKGNKYRATATTNCNDVSSRSHAVITFHVESRIQSAGADGVPKSELRLGKIHLVDLAGSERLGLSGAEGDTRLETQNINLSLTALGDVLSALSKNASSQNKQAKILQARLLNTSDLSGGSTKQMPSMVPVPYRNSKLTHLLKDSLGGNSKTVMICNIRTNSDFYQLTAISLMYAARAKKVRNRSLVNRNVIGDTGIHAVSSEIDRLKKSLEDRSREFGQIVKLQLRDANENTALKVRLQEMKSANENEKKLLENQVSQVIHSQAGHIAAQRQKISSLQAALQEELTLSQNRIAEQEKEIKWLKKALDETSLAAQGHNQDQMQRMQKVVEAWQEQAKTTHLELSQVLKQAEELKAINTNLMSKVDDLQQTKYQLQEELSERNDETNELTKTISDLLRKEEEHMDALRKLENESLQTRDLAANKVQAALDKEYALAENNKLLHAMENELLLAQQQVVQDRKSAQEEKELLLKKVKNLEKDKTQLTTRLSSTITDLDQKAKIIVDESNQQIRDLEVQLLETEKNLTDFKQKYEKVEEELKFEKNEKEKEISELTALLEKSESTSQIQANKILSMERMAQEFKHKYENTEKELKLEKNEKEKSFSDLSLLLVEKSELTSQQQANKILSMDGLAQEFKGKIESLQSKLKEKEEELVFIEETNNQLKSQKIQEIEEMTKKFHLEREQIILDFNSTIKKMSEDHAKELDELESSYEEHNEKIQKTHREEVQKHLETIKTLELGFAQKLQETEGKVRNLIDEEVNEGISSLERKHQEELNKIISEKDQILKDTIHQLETQKTQEMLEKFTNLEQKHTEEMENLKIEHERNVEDAIKQVEDEYHEELANRLSSMRRENAAELEDALAENEAMYQDLLNEKLQSVRKELEQQKEEAVIQVEQEQEKIMRNHLSKTLQEVREKQEILLAEIKQEAEEKYLQQLEDFKAEAEKDKNQALSTQQNDFTILTDQLRKSQESEINKAKEKLLLETTSKLEAEFRNSMEEKENTHREALKTLKEQFEANLTLKIQQVKEEAEEVKMREIQEVELKFKKEIREKLKETRTEAEQESEEIAANVRLELEEEFNLKIKDLRQKAKLEKETAVLQVEERCKQEYEDAMSEFRNSTERAKISALNAARLGFEVEMQQKLEEIKISMEREKENSVLKALEDHTVMKEDEFLEKLQKIRETAEKEKEIALTQCKIDLEQKWDLEKGFLEEQAKKVWEEKELNLKEEHKRELEEKMKKVEEETNIKLSAVQVAIRDEYERQLSLKTDALQVEVEEKKNAALKEQEIALRLEFEKQEMEIRETIGATHDVILQRKEDEFKNQLELQLEDLKLEMSKEYAGELSTLQQQLDAASTQTTKEMRENFEKQLLNLTIQHEDKISQLQLEHKGKVEELLKEKEIELKFEKKELAKRLQQDWNEEKFRQESELQSQFEEEISRLKQKHKQEVSNLQEEMSSVQAQHDETIKKINEQFQNLQLQHQENLAQALNEQQTQLLDRHRAELLKLRTERQNIETQHQEELSSALEEHLKDLSRQRQQLEASHIKVVGSLQEEIAEAQNRFHDAVTQAANRQTLDATQLQETRQEFERKLRAAVEKEVEVSQRELNKLKQKHELETKELTKTIEKLRSEQEQEKQFMSEDLQNAISAVEAKFILEKEQLEDNFNEEMMTNNAKFEQEIEELQEKLKSVEKKGSMDRVEAEVKYQQLLQHSHQTQLSHKEEINKLRKEFTEKQNSIELAHEEEIKKLTSNQQEQEARMRQKVKDQVKALHEAADKSVEEQKQISQNQLQEREERHRQALGTLQETLEKSQRNHIQELMSKENEIKEMEKKHLQNVNELKIIFEGEKNKIYRENEILLQKEIDRVNNENQLEILKLKENFENSKLLLNKEKENEKENLLKILENKENEFYELETTIRNLQSEIENLVQSEKNGKNREKSLEDTIIQLKLEMEEEKQNNSKMQLIYKDQISSLEIQRDLERKQIAETLEETLRKDAKESAEKFNELEDRYKKQIQGLKEESQKEKNTLIERIKALNEEAEHRVSKTESQFRKEISNLQDHLGEERNKVREIREKAEMDLVDLDSKNKTQLIRLQQDHAKYVQDLTSRLHSQHEEEIKLKLKVNTAELEENFNRQLMEVQRISDEKIENLENELQKLSDVEIASKTQIRAIKGRLDETVKEKNEFETHKDKMIQELRHELGLKEDKMKKEFEKEKTSMTEHFQSTLQANLENARKEIEQHSQEMKLMHDREIQFLKSQYKADLEALEEEKTSELRNSIKKVENNEDEIKNVKRQFMKAEALKESLQKEVDNLKVERHQLLDKINNLEVEIIEHGKPKFDSLLKSEKEQIEHLYRSSMQDLQNEVNKMKNDSKDAALKLGRAEMELSSVRMVCKAAEDERDRVEAIFKSLLNERESAHEAQLKRALQSQQDELQGKYFKLIQQQVNMLKEQIKLNSSNNNNNQLDDLQNRFMSLVEDLPELWKLKHGNFPVSPDKDPNLNQNLNRNLNVYSTGNSVGSTSAGGSLNRTSMSTEPLPKTPLRLLAQSSQESPSDRHQRLTMTAADMAKRGGHFSRNSGNQGFDGFNDEMAGIPTSVPWSSPTLRSSPTDQLIAAILDGDVQGIRSVVRSKGDDLLSDFWRDLARTVLPLHRAISGLHFHGSEKLLVSTIETLAQLGADVNATDHVGNSVLHKAIQVCTSKSAAAAVRVLLARGANPTHANKDGDSPLHAECKRVRTASVEVIEALIGSGADPNCRNTKNSSLTPLTLVLLRGAASTASGAKLMGLGEESTSFGMINSTPSHLQRSSVDDSREFQPFDNLKDNLNDSVRGSRNSLAEAERSRVAGRRVWIRAAEILIKLGAQWNCSWRSSQGNSQLHLLLAAFPPSREESPSYRALLRACLESGADPGSEDQIGRNSLFILCEQMATISSDKCPDASRVVQLLLEKLGLNGIGVADRTGRTVFDLEESIPRSCLSACSPILLEASQATASRRSSTSSLGRVNQLLETQNPVGFHSYNPPHSFSSRATDAWPEATSNSKTSVNSRNLNATMHEWELDSTSENPSIHRHITQSSLAGEENNDLRTSFGSNSTKSRKHPRSPNELNPRQTHSTFFSSPRRNRNPTNTIESDSSPEGYSSGMGYLSNTERGRPLLTNTGAPAPGGPGGGSRPASRSRGGRR